MIHHLGVCVHEAGWERHFFVDYLHKRVVGNTAADWELDRVLFVIGDVAFDVIDDGIDSRRCAYWQFLPQPTVMAFYLGVENRLLSNVVEEPFLCSRFCGLDEECPIGRQILCAGGQ